MSERFANGNRNRGENRGEKKEGVVKEDLGFSRVIYQDTRLYRFTSDSVLLSRFARAKRGDNVADFCSGCGIVAFHFFLVNGGGEKGSVSDGMRFTLFELQERLNDLARRTAQENDFDNFSFVTGRLQEMPKEYYGKFSLALCNPPYEQSGAACESYERAVCKKEIAVTFAEIAAAAKKALRFGGRLALSHRADRVAEIIAELNKNNFAVKRLQFVAGKAEDKPYLALIEAVQGGKNGTEVLPTLINEAKTGGTK
ncbi:MAG: methyltransferase domain-containing protein [Candidatus Borkfalkiaceae bacterium]|nr:methyltransferase domain-containing protein [Clostridia bacterium]MDY6223369.1 methyltransferase domain-containing protein [Christensenellaceae bacterium]